MFTMNSEPEDIGKLRLGMEYDERGGLRRVKMLWAPWKALVFAHAIPALRSGLRWRARRASGFASCSRSHKYGTHSYAPTEPPGEASALAARSKVRSTQQGLAVSENL